MRLALALAAVVTLAGAGEGWGYYAEGAGRPAARPLPIYCQMGECTLTTVEATDPVAFDKAGTLFRVESQNWYSTTSSTSHPKRGADSVSYVLCSKRMPAVVSPAGERSFMVDFLALNDEGSYGHSNETVIAMYFVVCHSRSFGDKLFEQGPSFASSVGYHVSQRDDQPTIDAPEKVLSFLPK